MSEIDLPPLPQPGASGPSVCELMRLYLAVWDDLTPRQQEMVAAHMRYCPHCVAERQMMQMATQLVGRMTASQPSPRVDQAIMAVIATQSGSQPLMHAAPAKRRRISRLMLAAPALAATLVLALLTFQMHLFGLGSSSPFALPSTLAWNGYVLHLTETLVDAHGEPYHISAYNDLSNGHTHVETVMDGMLDVVAVSDARDILGMDEMHHVAQWDAQAWNVDTSHFDLAQLRHDLQAGDASYLGMDRYANQDVYRVHLANGFIMLLDKQYMPVNVLKPEGTPLYDQLQWLRPSQVSDSLWDMQVPVGYHMGTLPPKP